MKVKFFVKDIIKVGMPRIKLIETVKTLDIQTDDIFGFRLSIFQFLRLLCVYLINLDIKLMENHFPMCFGNLLQTEVKRILIGIAHKRCL